jgi:hypothetical protein
LLTLRLPDDLVIRPSLTGLEPTTADRVNLERAERILRQIGELTTQIDRSSSRDRERIVSLTIAHEMAIRAAERSLQAGTRTLDGTRKERAEREIEALATNRKLLVESLRSAALDDELDSALAYLGLADAPAAKVPFSAPDSGNVETGRGLGRSVYLAGSSSGLNEEPTIITGSQADTDLDASQNPSQARAMLLLGILLPITLVTLARDLTGRWMTALLGIILGTLSFMGGLAIAGAAAVVAFAGWLTRFRTGSPATPANDPPPQIRLPQVTATTSTFHS